MGGHVEPTEAGAGAFVQTGKPAIIVFLSGKLVTGMFRSKHRTMHKLLKYAESRIALTQVSVASNFSFRRRV